jgi:hypothetical protein
VPHVDENRSPADRLLDLIVFGPAGLALTAAEEFPKLVDKGRSHLEGQVRTARIVGQVAVQMGRRQLDQFTASRPSKTPTPTPTAAAPVEPVVPAHPRPDGPPQAAPAEVDASVAVAHANGNGSSPPLAIPGYDSLSASQVVQRLAGLSRGELIDVRAHEESHRHRRTILNRVEQLLAGVDAE